MNMTQHTVGEICCRHEEKKLRSAIKKQERNKAAGLPVDMTEIEAARASVAEHKQWSHPDE